MYKKHLDVHHHKGSKLLLYTGIGLIFLIILLVVVAQTSIPPKTYFLDNGRLLIAECSGSPESILANMGSPLGKMDSLSKPDYQGSQSDRLYQVNRAKTVIIVDADKTWTSCTLERTVRDLVNKERDKFSLRELDRVQPSLDSLIKDKMEIKVSRVMFKDETRAEKIAPDFKLVNDPNLIRGKMITEKAGKPGVKETTYRKFFINGKLSQTQKLKEKVITKPEPGVKKVGSRVVTISRSGYRGKRVLEMVATAYDAGPLSTGKSADGVTATGVKAKYGIVAVDPRVIPLGTRLFVEGYGYAVAADTGGAIKGLRIDLFYESRKEALKFGRRKVKVYIIE